MFSLDNSNYDSPKILTDKRNIIIKQPEKENEQDKDGNKHNDNPENKDNKHQSKNNTGEMFPTKSEVDKKITLAEIYMLCPNDFLEKFELLEIIKSGSAGVMIRGQLKNKENNEQNKQFGFKFLIDLKEKRDSKRKTKRNNNKHLEISIHGKLKNIHFPEIYGYYKIEDYSCIAMEYIKYGDLENFKKKILKRSYLSETWVLYIAGGIIEALHYLHLKAKIIHMDIKQQNVLIDDFLTIKLTDFSVSIPYKYSKEFIDLPMVGTCYYMSPEILGRKRILVTEASKIDVYSLGVLLYLLAYCDYPYKLNSVNSKDYSRIAKNIEENNLEFPDDTGHSVVFQDFLKNCLNKDIKKRFNILQVMNHPWYKGYQIILNEKDKLYNACKFVIDLMIDNIYKFNEYLKEIEKKLN